MMNIGEELLGVQSVLVTIMTSVFLILLLIS